MQNKQLSNKIQQAYINLCKKQNVSKISRDVFCKSTPFTQYQVEQNFGSFSALKESCLKFLNVKQAKTKISNTSDEAIESHYVDMNEYYSVNSITGNYRFNFSKVKNIGKTIILPKFTVYAILQAYSNFDNKTLSVKKIADIHKLSTWVVKAILKALNITHDELPVTEDDYINKQEDTIISDVVKATRDNVHSKVQEALLLQDRQDAYNWRRFEETSLKAYKDLIKNWNPPKFKAPALPQYKVNDKTYVVTLSDIHFGAKANAEELYHVKEDWNVERTKKCIENYLASIMTEVKNMSNRPSKCVLLSLGDIIHTLSGFTDKHTPLEFDDKGPQLLKTAAESLTYFISGLLSIFKEIEVKTVVGNHDSNADYGLFLMLSYYFHTEKRIKFTNNISKWLHFTVGKNLIIMEHGYSAHFKSKVPKGDISRENYIQKIIYTAQHDLMSNGKAERIKNNYFFMGDQHHFNSKAYSTFEFIQLPTCVRADLYADHLNLFSRAKQCTFLFDNELGLISTTNHYI